MEETIFQYMPTQVSITPPVALATDPDLEKLLQWFTSEFLAVELYDGVEPVQLQPEWRGKGLFNVIPLLEKHPRGVAQKRLRLEKEPLTQKVFAVKPFAKVEIPARVLRLKQAMTARLFALPPVPQPEIPPELERLVDPDLLKRIDQLEAGLFHYRRPLVRRHRFFTPNWAKRMGPFGYELIDFGQMPDPKKLRPYRRRRAEQKGDQRIWTLSVKEVEMPVFVETTSWSGKHRYRQVDLRVAGSWNILPARMSLTGLRR